MNTWKEHWKQLKKSMKQMESSPKEALYLTPSRAVLEQVIQRHVEWRFPGTSNQGRREASTWELIYFKREPMCNIVWAECLLMDEFHFRVMVRLIG